MPIDGSPPPDRPAPLMNGAVDDLLAIEQTKNWIQAVVIDLNLCPFARRPFENAGILYQTCPHPHFPSILDALDKLFGQMDRDDRIETALLILTRPDSECFRHFEDYLDLLALCQQLLEARGDYGTYQLASFHPDYRFANSHADDAANFTNRSPYPMLHVLREASLERALKHHPAPETIPESNIANMRALGSQTLERTLQSIRKQDTPSCQNHSPRSPTSAS